MRSFRWTCMAMFLALATSACQDLDVPNTNAPDRERAQADPEALWTLASVAYRDIWTHLHRSSSAYGIFPTLADEGTATYANYGSLELTSEPRVGYNNNPTAEASGLARYGWEYYYTSISNAVDALKAIDNGVEIIVGEDQVDETETVEMWSKFVMALGHGYLAMLYDKAFIEHPGLADVPVEERELLGWEMVQDTAIRMMDDFIQYAQAHPDLRVPELWFGPQRQSELDMQTMVEIANFEVAKWLIYSARTPEQRENTDWDEVLRRLDAGPDETIWMDLLSTGGWYLSNVNFLIRESWGPHADQKLFGPADISGEYQEWLSLPWPDRNPIFIVTPDKRFPQSKNEGARGVYFEVDTNGGFYPERGMYHHSNYQWESEYSSYYNRPYEFIPKKEIDLFRAEALYFKGDMQGAADLINNTRVGIGQLPPVTAQGVPGGPGSCVPHKSTTTQQCGDLYEALMYERMIELFGHTSHRGYTDSRGFGRLSEGTMLQLPVPGRELGSLGIELYSFGGIGGPWAAPAPIR